MTLKQFVEKSFEENFINAMDMAREMIELEAIERRLNVMYGVQLDIRVKPQPKQQGRFYGESLIKMIDQERANKFNKS